MNNEDFERTKEFILKQQAQFTSGIQQLREAQVRTEQVVVQTGEIVARLANATLEGFKDVNSKINGLVDSQIRTDERMSALADSEMHTKEDLRNLIVVVDRYLSEGRNGN